MVASTIKGASLPQQAQSVCLAIKVAWEFVIEHRHCASELSGTVLIVSEQREALPLTSIVLPKRASGAAKG